MLCAASAASASAMSSPRYRVTSRPSSGLHFSSTSRRTEWAVSPANTRSPSSRAMYWPSLTEMPLALESRTAMVTSMLRIPAMAACMDSRFRSIPSPGLKARRAAIPWGRDRVGTTESPCPGPSAASPARLAAWRAAGITLGLLGSRITCDAPVCLTASRSSPALGFIVCPPTTTAEQPSSSNRPTSPSPQATATTARVPSTAPGPPPAIAVPAEGLVPPRWDAKNSPCCSSMLWRLTSRTVPRDTA